MPWIARLDTHAARWPPLWTGLYLLIKWTLVALGAFLWVMLWWARHPALGIMQGSAIGMLLFRHLRRD